MSDLSPVLLALENSNFSFWSLSSFFGCCCCFCYICVFVYVYILVYV